MTHTIRFITENHQLEALCQEWQQVPALAIDTEFIRTDTFYPIPALLQIYDGKTCYLLDPVTLTDLTVFMDVLRNPAVVKILHACTEDLEIFESLLQTLPTPLFDTQIAAAFLGYGFSVGYSRLVKVLFSADLPKDESRSNWLQRPLTADQIEYAALDVIYLYQIYSRFSAELDNSPKKEWVAQCNQELIEHYRFNQKPEHYFQRIKNAWRLSPEQQQHLFQMCYWREQEARRRNKPRNRIMRDEILFEHALKNTRPSGFRGEGHTLAPLPKMEKPLPREAGGLIQLIKEHTEQTAERLNIAAEMLARKKDISAYVSSGYYGSEFQLPSSLAGWRKTIIGDRFLEITNVWQKNSTVSS